jgi:hypothetical protein
MSFNGKRRLPTQNTFSCCAQETKSSPLTPLLGSAAKIVVLWVGNQGSSIGGDGIGCHFRLQVGIGKRAAKPPRHCFTVQR